MPSKTINMHGKLYTLFDETKRTQVLAQKQAQIIRDNGQVAFLNPCKTKNKKTTYYIYVAEKAIRPISSKKTISIETIVSELSKGKQSFIKWGIELSDSLLKVQKEIPKKEIPKKIVSKKFTKKKVVPKKKTPKKVVPKKKTPKKTEKPLLIN